MVLDAVATSESALLRALEMLKATAGPGTVHHPSDSIVTGETDDSVDEYQPGQKESEQDHADETTLVTLKNAHRVTQRAMLTMEREGKQRHADEQVGFIIIKRDNNKPDAYGESSETYGPLPWPGVAEAYNKKYDMSVGPAAMEKRARQHRPAWLAKHPGYPLKIMYAKKPKTQAIRRSKVAALHAQAPCVQAYTSNQKMRVDKREGSISNERIAGWMPPDAIRNRADVHNYIDDLMSAHVERVVLEVHDAHDSPSEVVIGDLEYLGSSSVVLQQLMAADSETTVQVDCSSLEVVQWYVQCSSAGCLTKAPVDLHHGNGSLMDLYCLAAQLQDDDVCGLILTLWRSLAEKNVEMDLSVESMNLLFETTRYEDPARGFWVDIAHRAKIAPELIKMGGCNAELIAAIQSKGP
ncbi:hypothetical protein J4E90_000933 [Alternaria incomplexa]|uniref:uncharacterized protein n=1 Tax=Alternaria incomplexa TaxID=1187928 RepID=UPI002220E1C5|nr:uncharacterized protein J4E90_000933 [Alternaria incomplexa]KAI4922502.1 hypothetical protein J4E90_000933 [Alternaria incomplexa]